MKKLICSLCIAGAFLFAACDPNDFINDLVDQVFGEANVVLVDNNGGTILFPNGPGTDSLNFSSCVANAMVDSTMRTIFLSANVNLTESEVITYPFLGMQVNDTVARSYAFDTLSKSKLTDFDVTEMLTTGSNMNLLVLAVSDTSWYVSNGGTATIDTFPGYGKEIQGSFHNVEMWSLTQHSLDSLSHLNSRALTGDPVAIATLATLNMENLFPRATMAGTFSSRRMNITNLLNSIH